MSPRPRTASDEDILAATHRVISTVGARFTLADVAKEVGLAPATLIQRFQSKRGLIIALATSASGGTEQQMADIRQMASGPLAALFAVGDCYAQMAPSPDVLANHLAFLQMDLTDPEMHDLALEQARAMTGELKKILEEAVRAGELVPHDTGRMAIAIQSLQGGSLLSWAILRDGTAQRFLRRDLEMLLNPYMPGGARARGKAKKKGRARQRRSAPSRD
jgi:AcrR family transcriptional regulator